MKSQEVAIGGRSEINGVMESDILGLDEVVVTALGITRQKKALGYSVSDVKGDAIANTRETNIVNALQGLAPGCSDHKGIIICRFIITDTYQGY